MKKLNLLMAAFFVASVGNLILVPSGYGDNLTANAADGTINAISVLDTNNWNAQAGQLVTDQAFIIPFQLPTLGGGDGFLATTLRVMLYLRNVTTFNVDVYGLSRVSASPSIQPSDFFIGASDGTATLIQEDILTPTSPTMTETFTDGTGDANLAAWLNTRYAGGANAGQYVFIRLSADLNPSGDNRYDILTQNAGGATEKPLITYTAGPYTPPDVSVLGLSNLVITNGDVEPTPLDDTDFGLLDLNQGGISHTFTITNSSTTTLHLNGSPRVMVSGPQADDFMVTAQPASPVAGGETTTFDLLFTPSATGLRQATLSIASDDGDENPYTFTVQGTGTFDLDAYPFRMPVQFNGYGRDEGLTNFPALVVLGSAVTNFTYASFLDAAGGDLRFLDGSQTVLLKHEIETWNTNGASYVWVRVPELVGTNTTIWAVWGNPAQTTAPAYTTDGSTWSESYVGVWHLGETSGTFNDSVADNDGTLLDDNASSVMGTNSLIGTGIRLVGGEADIIEIANEANFKLSANLSVMVWAKGLSGSAWAPWVSKNGEGSGYALRRRGAGTPAEPDWCTRGAGGEMPGGSTIASTNWNFIAGTLGSGSVKTKRLFINGTVAVESTNVTGSIIDNAEPLMIGARTNPAAYWGGIIDEVRISSVARSTNWVWAEFQNSGSNSVFNGYGAVQGGPEMAVLGTNLGEIAAGSGSPSSALGTDFGPVTLGNGSWADRTFTLTNAGNVTLALEVSPFLTVSGAAAAEYSLLVGPSRTNLTPGQTATFTVRFQPSLTGTRTALLSMNHNDVDENPYTFTIAGTGVFDPEIYASSLPVQFCGYNRDETLTNFPALVVLSTNITGFSYSQFLSETGGDLRFSDGAQVSLLNFEIESWDTNGSSYVWVQLPALTGTNTSIYAYWGNASATTLPAYATNGATWSERFAGVWHLAETSGDSRDSTANGLTGYPSNDVNQAVNGQVNGADDFGGTASRTFIGSPAVLNNLTNNFTASAWIRPDGVGAPNQVIFGSSWEGLHSWSMRLAGANLAIERLPGGPLTPGVAVTAGQWAAVTITYDAANFANFFINGVHVGTVTGTTAAAVATQPWSIGANTGDRFNGIIDEVQVSQIARSSNWIWAAYQNTRTDGSFTCFGEVSGGEGPSNDNDGDGLPNDWEILYGLDSNASNTPTANADGDWMTDLEEYVADTSPINTNSVFPLITRSNTPPSVLILVINPTSTGRVYGIHANTNLMQNPQSWVLFSAEQPGNGSALGFTITNEVSGRNYRTGVRLP